MALTRKRAKGRLFPRVRTSGFCSSILVGGAKALAIASIGWSIVGCGGGGEILGSIGSTVGDASSETFTDGAIGSPDGSVESDKGGDERTVDADLGPFGPPVLVPELSDPAAYDEDPTFTDDLLELYFTSSRAGSLDIWRSLRATTGDRWGAPSRVDELSSPASEETPSISLDGLTIWFASTRPGSHKANNLWVSSRVDRSSPWSAPSEVTELNSDGDDLSPATNGNDLIMAFASDRAGSAGHDIYFAGRASKGGPWSAPVLVDSINSKSNDWDPFLSDDALVLFFNSDRAGMAGDLYWAMRSSLVTPFGPAIPLSELNSPANDSDPALSRDLRYIMFASNRSGNSEIYEARR